MDTETWRFGQGRPCVPAISGRNAPHIMVAACAAIIVTGCAAHHTKGITMQQDGATDKVASYRPATDKVASYRPATDGAGFLTKTMDVNGTERRYAVYVPADYASDQTWPLIVFLHGIGERGEDGLFQTEVGIGRAIRRHADRFPCVVVMPQCPRKALWTGAFDHIDTAVADVCSAYTIDPDRIYLTGLSMGGFGTWIYGARHPDRFAALVPICGGGNPKDAPALARIPIWAFHGADDATVPPKKSRDMVEAIQQANGDVKYTEYPGTGHNSWDQAYDNPQTIRWLLGQRRNKK